MRLPVNSITAASNGHRGVAIAGRIDRRHDAQSRLPTVWTVRPPPWSVRVSSIPNFSSAEASHKIVGLERSASSALLLFSRSDENPPRSQGALFHMSISCSAAGQDAALEARALPCPADSGHKRCCKLRGKPASMQSKCCHGYDPASQIKANPGGLLRIIFEIRTETEKWIAAAACRFEKNECCRGRVVSASLTPRREARVARKPRPVVDLNFRDTAACPRFDQHRGPLVACLDGFFPSRDWMCL